MFWQYPLSKGFKERAVGYSTIMATISLIAFALSILAGDGLLTYFQKPVGADFLAFYTGGAFFNQGILNQAYVLNDGMYFPHQFEYQKGIIGEGYNDQNTYVNPPFTALLYAPFALLDYLPAYILWEIFNLSLLVLSVLIIRRELSFLKAFSLPKIIFCCFLFYPTLGWLFNGQATPIILLIYSLCFASLRNRKDFQAGFYLGLLAFKPQLAVGLALVLLWKLRWQSLLGGVLSVSLAVGLGFLLVPEAMITYWDISPNFIDLLRLPNYPTWGIHSFFGLAVLLFDGLNPAITMVVTITLSAITLIFLLNLWRKNNWLEDKRLWDLSMAVTLCWGLLLSPHLFYYDLMLLLLPAAIMSQHLKWLYARDNKILMWTTIVWVICYLGSYISLAQINIFSTFDLPKICLQLSTPILFYWGYRIYKVTIAEYTLLDQPTNS
ncbi:glycosyltransferase family 87 protein [Kiloniella sp.]|uniref:glycosyltransferase family 87 protein n=1 Tax=Kiloniella sp. TaxID=1938587 RepID=UPI003B025F51